MRNVRKVKPRKMSDKIPTKGYQDPGLRWFFRYMTKYVTQTHYPLIVLHVFTVGTCGLAAGFLFRGLRSPDVGVIKNKLAWENIPPTHQYQLYSPEFSYYESNKDRPKPE